MGTFSIWHWVIVLVVVLVLFGGGGKLSRLMGDMARGITSFKKGLKEGESSESSTPSDEPKTIDATAKAEVADPVKKDEAAKN